MKKEIIISEGSCAVRLTNGNKVLIPDEIPFHQIQDLIDCLKEIQKQSVSDRYFVLKEGGVHLFGGSGSRYFVRQNAITGKYFAVYTNSEKPIQHADYPVSLWKEVTEKEAKSALSES
jgi:hypothetical protein